jgi:hypothetical protein
VAVKPVFTNGLADKDWLAIDTNASSPHVNTLYISTTQFDSAAVNSRIAVSHSSDSGKTWTTSVVDPVQKYPTVDQWSDLAIGKDGTAYVTWQRCTANGPAGDCGGTVASMMFSKSTNGGTTWSTPVVMAKTRLVPDKCQCAFYGSLPNTAEPVSNIPAIGVDNSAGAHARNLYVAMYNWTGTTTKVQAVTSSNGGTTWSKPVVVSAAVRDQFFPWLSVGPTGIVGVSWLDRRNDPANTSYQAFAALSLTGGTTFTQSHVISTAQSNPANDGFGGTFMGSYTGNAWAGNTLFVSWMDSRSGVNMQTEVGGFVQ